MFCTLHFQSKEIKSLDLWTVNARVMRGFPPHISELNTSTLPKEFIFVFVWAHRSNFRDSSLNFHTCMAHFLMSLSMWLDPWIHHIYGERWLNSSFVGLFLSNTTVVPVTRPPNMGARMAWVLSFTTVSFCHVRQLIKHSSLPLWILVPI